MKAEIVSIGTELLMGELTDTNASFIASRLPPLGIQVQWISQVGDDLDMLVDALTRGLTRSEIIFTHRRAGPHPRRPHPGGRSKDLGGGDDGSGGPSGASQGILPRERDRYARHQYQAGYSDPLSSDHTKHEGYGAGLVG